MPPKAILDPADFPRTVLLDKAAIRDYNRQRFEMEMITAVTGLDLAQEMAVGYVDAHADDFWARGHIPGLPLMPGVLMIEALAQVSSAFIGYHKILAPGDFLGFGGIENVRFRGLVRPGDRLWLVSKLLKRASRRYQFAGQGFVEGTMVFEGEFLGLVLSPAQMPPTRPQDQPGGAAEPPAAGP